MTDKQRKNIGRLALLLKDTPEANLDMQWYVRAGAATAPRVDARLWTRIKDTMTELKQVCAANNCGAVYCAIGLAAQSKIPAFRPLREESWNSYSDRVFAGDDNAVWEHLFDARLAGQVTPQSLALRMAAVALGKVPSAACNVKRVSWEKVKALVDG